MSTPISDAQIEVAARWLYRCGHREHYDFPYDQRDQYTKEQVRERVRKMLIEMGLGGHKAAEQHAVGVPASPQGDAEITRDEAREQRDRARNLACRLEEELALIRRAATARRHG